LQNRYIYQYRDHLGNARVSFAKNSEGALEITDTNNYYPFGLNHIEGMLSTSNFGGYYSYKYNGKELQETGMYDYGARMYMPDVGRWGVIDPRSQYTHEAYSYVWNNPISFGILQECRENWLILIGMVGKMENFGKIQMESFIGTQKIVYGKILIVENL